MTVLFATTLSSSNPITLLALISLPAILILLTSTRAPSTNSKPFKRIGKHAGTSSTNDVQNAFPVKPFVTNYRGLMLIITCCSILAVDFKVFPRRFAKVENWGTSLMDIGVGSFVFSAGLVSIRPVLKERFAGKPRSLMNRLTSSFRHALPLFVLGLIRLYTVKGLDYAEHVSEYGVHWNFFFTLALLPPFVALFDSAFSVLPSYAVLALVLGVIYEIVLDSTGLEAYILAAPRKDLLSQNREGVFSFLGYLAIFLAGQGCGMHVLPRYGPTQSLIQNPALRKLGLWSFIWSAFFFLTIDYRYGANLQVSRRLANLPYILGVCAFNSWQMFLCCLIEATLFPDIYQVADRNLEHKSVSNSCSRLLRAFNRNGLAVFLIANLLTGLVNLTLPTLHMTDIQAMAVLIIYMAVLSFVALTLDVFDISIKL